MAECAMGPKDETANGLLSPVSLWPPARVWFRVAHSETSLQGALHVLIPWQETGFIIPGQRWEREVRRTGLAFGSEFKSPTSQFPQNILQENHTEKPKMLHPSNEAFWYLTTGLISRTFYSFFFCHTNKNNANLFIWDLENGEYDGTHPKVLEERIRIDFKVLG